MNIKVLAVLLVVIVVAAVLFWPVEADTVNEPVPEEEATDDKPATIAWAKVDFYFGANGPSGYNRATEDDFWFDKIRVSKGEYHAQDPPTQSVASLLAQSLKWGTHQWEAKCRLQVLVEIATS